MAYACCKWVPYFCKNHVDCRSKTYIFLSNHLECKTKPVCSDEKHANSWIFHHPTVGSQKLNTLLPRIHYFGIPKHTWLMIVIAGKVLNEFFGIPVKKCIVGMMCISPNVHCHLQCLQMPFSLARQ